ncbi:bifunctional UDP-N-acetylglucosamine diphosphorylase/glucosamine-1-phosphate N-acetyltransferase GlmU [Tsukamurella sp. 8F]|uniref:bifunctional UDP-N-acetylglucosamine diphosphorylase/glucosamine-1-phosphate N-acetyltransferase GlmU n=1 Tax=unclassified Tsukamurella TaxID=2633480 RepID=UPI0023B8E58E|nr:MULTISPECIES: bifunctional UDP-N-acetylglucosamine diphosphorylase/glucosamine-1-phosphate N-acetyltransferase GlmU [unclassified Tsukamurella]MDF0530240.1 bifunctional UDP-N-acetylglucosamine diphosphorylase/glucosamine-1-phosphate N-acetyltransferase GlmU [Tsukamurella sp. 8J]MDF0586557.1 bifunctional UDP-N-acetylglucosamine diphosphorylase/glucosamine-1-phosphate N-acetyltransferase GlmU [Tsukamurella sp. 8F]
METTTPADTTGTAVIILAAGAGTRMKSKTPKVLHSIGGRTLLGHVVHAAADVSPDHLVVVVGHERERVSEAALASGTDAGRDVLIAVQEQPNGTGDAVRAGLDALPDGFDGTVVVTAADVPLLDSDTVGGLLAAHTREPAAAVTVLSFTAQDPSGYGRVLRTQDGHVTEIVEEADATPEQKAVTEVNSGVYAFAAPELRSALAQLTSRNSQAELYLTDVVEIANRDGHTVRSLHCDDPLLVAGCNDRAQLSELGVELNRRIVHAHQIAGVTVVDPASTWIEVGVRIAQDVTVEPGTHLKGATVLDEDAVVGPDTTLVDTHVLPGAHVVRSQVHESVIGAGAIVGPFSYLRPGTDLGAKGKIGAFAETKNASVGEGSKIPHLSYVGDATIGQGTNIGCATVFVNYDGVNKHRTVVGDHVRIGSDTMLVAPLTVGDGAYTAAGTVLKEDVPPGALAVSSGKQRNIEDWVVRRRPGTASADAATDAIARMNEQ